MELNEALTALRSVQPRLVRFEAVGECWEWQGTRGKYGHGALTLDGRGQSAYRVVYELLCGPVPDGLELDHVCRNPPCVRPDHLEPVTHAENMRRGSQSFDVRTHCLSERHELAVTGVITRVDGRQQCRACRNEGKRRYRARNAAARAA